MIVHKVQIERAMLRKNKRDRLRKYCEIQDKWDKDIKNTKN